MWNNECNILRYYVHELYSNMAVVCFQELEIVMGDQHISFTTSKIGSLIDVNQCKYVSNIDCTCTKQEQVV